jgi:hypothetical protein
VAQVRDQKWALVNTMMNLGFHKRGELLEWLSDRQLLKKGSAPGSWLRFLALRPSGARLRHLDAQQGSGRVQLA